MSSLQISDELAQLIQREAAEHGVPIEDFLKAVLQRERTLTDRLKIEQEQEWWLSSPLGERTKYEGEFVAVHNQRLVDHDREATVLTQRVRAQFGKTAILIMPAEGPREIRIFSPRLIQK